jgi:hypothetical protein
MEMDLVYVEICFIEFSNGFNEYRYGLDQLMTLFLEWKNGLDE